jgi:hypothetical protein
MTYSRISLGTSTLAVAASAWVASGATLIANVRLLGEASIGTQLCSAAMARNLIVREQFYEDPPQHAARDRELFELVAAGDRDAALAASPYTERVLREARCHSTADRAGQRIACLPQAQMGDS